MVMLIWMRVRVRAMARFQTEVSEVLMLDDAPARVGSFTNSTVLRPRHNHFPQNLHDV